MATPRNQWQAKTSSVKIEFSIWVILLLIITMSTLTWFMLRLEREALTREVNRRGVALAQYVATHSIDPFLTNDKLSLATLVADAMKNEDVVYAVLVNRDSRVVASDRSDQVGKAYQRPPGLYPLDRPQPNTHLWLDSDSDWIMDIGIPLILEKTKIGEVHLGVSQSTIHKVVSVAWRRAAGLAGIFLLAGLIGSIVLVSLMMKPVSELTRGVQAISAGDWDYQIPVKRRNELGQLAATFNRMTRELKTATEQALEQERIKKELQVAQQIQVMLLPKHTPEIEGFSFGSFYRAAKEVGGDYYDFLPVGDHSLGIAVADVCGKGVPAALVMSVARSILKSVAPVRISPADVVIELNNLLRSDLSGGLFITLFYAVVDVKKRTLTFTSAGHNPLLIWHAQRQEFETLNLEPPCLPLGIDNSSLFKRLVQERKVLLKPGDLVILYTDGVTEAMNARREAFELEGLMKSIRKRAGQSAQAIIRGLEEDLSAHCGEQNQSDDIAVIAMKVEQGS